MYIHVPFLLNITIYPKRGHGGPKGTILDRVPTHLRAQSHLHTGQYTDVNQPRIPVFGQGRKPSEHRENIHTHGEGRNQTPNRGDAR